MTHYFFLIRKHEWYSICVEVKRALKDLLMDQVKGSSAKELGWNLTDLIYYGLLVSNTVS